MRGMLGAIAFMAAPVEAQTHRLSLNVGAFSLQGEDTRIDDDVVVETLGLFAFTVDDFRGGSVGAEWLVETGDFLEVGVGVGFYRKTVLSVYNDFVNDDGTEADQANENGMTALLFACQYGRVDAARVLLDRGADVYRSNSENTTPLLQASYEGHIEIVQLLLDSGAVSDLDRADNDGEPPIDCAKSQGHTAVVDLLEKYVADS